MADTIPDQNQWTDRSIQPGSNAVTVIEPATGWFAIDWRELWRYRELFWVFVWRDIKVKYKQTLLGVVWAVLVPFVQMVVFAVIFGRVAGLPSDGLPSAVFYYAALLPWTYFATALSRSSTSLVASSQMVTKIYFPRVILPAAPCIAGLIDLAIALTILIGLMWWYGVTPAATAVLAPLLILVALGTALGTSLILSALHVRYRDVGYVVPFLIQVWMYLTVILPFSSIPKSWGWWRYLYGVNPMAGVVEGFRWCLLHPHMHIEQLIGGHTGPVPVPFPWPLIVCGSTVMLIVLAIGLYYFNRTERFFADVV